MALDRTIGIVGGQVYPFDPAGHETARRYINDKETTMSPLRERMIEDMTLAGLALGTRRAGWQPGA